MAQRADQRGFTLLELVVVIAIISILAGFALDRYARLLVDVERTSMQHDLGVMRSAISMQFAGYYVAGNQQGLAELVGSNPMDLLAEKPSNYVGEFRENEIGGISQGSWYFNRDIHALEYLVRNTGYFETELIPERARFKIYPVYSEERSGVTTEKYLAGLRLNAIEPYKWLRD